MALGGDGRAGMSSSGKGDPWASPDSSREMQGEPDTGKGSVSGGGGGINTVKVGSSSL